MSKRYKQCSYALFVKAYKQCSNVGIYVKTLQTLQTLHIFESQARVRIYINIILPLYEIFPQIYHLNLWKNGI